MKRLTIEEQQALNPQERLQYIKNSTPTTPTGSAPMSGASSRRATHRPCKSTTNLRRPPHDP
jgi:hypothetical protein